MKTTLLILAICLESIICVAQDLVPFQDENGKWGYKNSKDKVVVEPIYDAARQFLSGTAQVLLNKKYGFIDITGKVIIPIELDDVHIHHADFVMAEQNDSLRIFFIKTGQIFDDIRNLSEGLYPVKLNDKWGFVDNTGATFISFHFDYAEPFSNGLAKVELNGSLYWIDKKGKRFDNAYETSGLINVTVDDKHGYIDFKGKEITPIKYTDAGLFSEDLAKVEFDGKWGFIDRNGREVISPKYDWVGEFTDGLARVEFNGKMGWINKKGKAIIPIKYNSAGDFIDGLARVRLNDLWGFIDRNGKVIIPIKYDIAYDFAYGLAGVRLNDKIGYINKSGNTVVPVEYNHSRRLGFGNRFVGMEKDSLFYVYDLLNKQFVYKDLAYLGELSAYFIIINDKTFAACKVNRGDVNDRIDTLVFGNLQNAYTDFFSTGSSFLAKNDIGFLYYNIGLPDKHFEILFDQNTSEIPLFGSHPGFCDKGLIVQNDKYYNALKIENDSFSLFFKENFPHIIYTKDLIATSNDGKQWEVWNSNLSNKCFIEADTLLVGELYGSRILAVANNKLFMITHYELQPNYITTIPKNILHMQKYGPWTSILYTSDASYTLDWATPEIIDSSDFTPKEIISGYQFGGMNKHGDFFLVHTKQNVLGVIQKDELYFTIGGERILETEFYEDLNQRTISTTHDELRNKDRIYFTENFDLVYNDAGKPSIIRAKTNELVSIAGAKKVLGYYRDQCWLVENQIGKQIIVNEQGKQISSLEYDRLYVLDTHPSSLLGFNGALKAIQKTYFEYIDEDKFEERTLTLEIMEGEFFLIRENQEILKLNTNTNKEN